MRSLQRNNENNIKKSGRREIIKRKRRVFLQVYAIEDVSRDAP